MRAEWSRRIGGMVGVFALAVSLLYVASRGPREGVSLPTPGAALSAGDQPPAFESRSSPSAHEAPARERSAAAAETPTEARAAPPVPTTPLLPCRLAGRITDEEGHPIPGAPVELELSDDDSGVANPKVLTGEQGEYRFPEPLPAGSTQVVVDAMAYHSRVFPLVLVPGDNVFDGQLQRAVLVSGVVVNEAGQPVAGVDLSLDPSPRPPHTPSGAMTIIDSTDSGGDGTFHLKAMHPGGYLVRMDPPEGASGYLFTQQTVSAPARGLRLVLRSDMHLEVEVVDEEGRPVRRAPVAARCDPEQDAQSEEHSTDEAGKALLEGFEPGRCQVVARVPAEGHLRTASGLVEARSPGGVRVRLQLHPGTQRLSGEVVDREGRPLAGAEVRVMPLFPSPSPDAGPAREPAREFQMEAWREGTGQPLQTGAQGRFSVSGLEPGPYEVKAEKAGYQLGADKDGDALSPEGGVRASAGAQDVRLVMDFVGVVRGRVVDEQGAPITDFQVDDEHFTHEQGLFERTFEESDEQEWTFQARGVTGLRLKVRGRENEVVDVGRVVLRRGHEVRVRVLDARTSEPVEGVQVDVLGPSPRHGEADSRLELIRAAPKEVDGVPDEDSERDFSTSAEGLLVLRNVEEQPLRLMLTDPEYRTASVPLGARQGEVVVRLHPIPAAP